MRIEWTGASFDDRIAIFDYIAADNTHAARATDERIRSQTLRLALFPYSARKGRHKDIRELVISGTPYIVAYLVMENAIRILRVVHGAQEWPHEMSREL